MVLNISMRGTTDKKDSLIVFFPDTRLFPVVFLDPLECQISGGSYLLSQEGKETSLYSIVNLGFNKPIIAKYGKKNSYDFTFGAAVFSQFELIRKDDGTYLAGLLNNDYKINGDFNIKWGNNILKFRIFHLSSHLGDDYMLRNDITDPNDKSVNYEQIDFTYMRLFGSNYLYAGLGEIYTRYVYRERFSFQGGGLLNIGKPKPVNLFTSINIKLLEENDFNPDIRSGFGASFNIKSESIIRIWIEYYSGQLPYSTLDYGRVNWFGLSIWINLL
jgi:hypothetical protein